MSILIKAARGKGDLALIKQAIRQSIDTIAADKKFRGVRIVVDVDPV
jgi:hypothetical protein